MPSPLNRPWIKLHARLLRDDDFLDLSDSARLVFLMSLVKGADTGGTLPSAVQQIARYAGVDAAVADKALLELVNTRFWTWDGGELRIRTFDKYNVPHDEYERQAAQATERKRRQRQRDNGALETEEMRDIRERFIAILEEQIAECDSADRQQATYEAMHDDGISKCHADGRYGEIFAPNPTALADATARHAAARMLQIVESSPQMRRIVALRRRAGRQIFQHIREASERSDRDPVAYLERLCGRSL